MPDSRSLALILCGAFLFSCSDDRGPSPSEPAGALRPAGACKVTAIEGLIPQIYAVKKHQSEASGFCGEVARLQDKGQYLEAVTTAYAWLTRTFDLYRADELVGGSEPQIQELFHDKVFGVLLAPSFVALPDDDPPDLSSLADGLHLDPDLNGVVVEEFGEACDELAGVDDPCIATTPNRHAALKLRQNGVHVVVTILPPQGAFGDCTAISDALSHDCFDFQLQVAVFPADAVVEPGVIGVCVDDKSAFAPPDDVSARLRVTKGETDGDGNLTFLPTATAPATLDCSDVTVMPGLRGAVWTALGPARRLFSPRPAFANPGKLGASMGAFSPVVPVDQDVRTGTISGVARSVFDEVSGADVTVRDSAGVVVATTMTDADGTFLVEGLPILGETGSTYTVTVVRNGTLQDTEQALLEPFPPGKRDVTLEFDLVPPGHE